MEPTLRTTPDEDEEGPARPSPGVKGQAKPRFRPPHVTADQQWLRLGYILIAVLLVARLAYVAGKTIELCEDEAYQWLWSKHLALSYYSKPPMIAYVQFLGTHLWGDNAFAVFVITTHYGMAGMISFYLPEAREHVSDSPLVYFMTCSIPHNQLYFWPGYTQRKGENAILVQELDRNDPTPRPPARGVESEFESITDLGVRYIMYHGGLWRPVQLFACRGLK